MVGFVDHQANSWEACELAGNRIDASASRADVEEALRQTVDNWAQITAKARVAEEQEADESVLYTARSMAALAHSLLQTAYTLDADSSAGGASFGSVSNLYNSLLDRARSVAQQEHQDFAAIHQEAVDLAVGPATELAKQTGALSRAERGNAMIGTRTSELLRRCAAFVGAAAYLENRSTDGPSQAGLRRLAANRPVLRRSFSNQRFAYRSPAGRAFGDRFEISGRVTDVGWIDRPQTPYSFARLAGANFELRVHYRSMVGVGVAPGRWVWAKAKYEMSDDGPIMVAEFEGLGNHSGSVWEDWLGEQIRPAYDLAPSSLDVSWELPDPRYRCGTNDLRSRIAGSIGG